MSDHYGGAASEFQHAVGADLRHQAVDLRLRLTADFYDQTLNDDASRLDGDAAGADAQLDAAQGLRGTTAQVEARRLVPGLDGQNVVAHFQDDGAIAVGARRGIVRSDAVFRGDVHVISG